MVTSRARLAPGVASAFRGAMARSQTVETQLVCLEVLDSGILVHPIEFRTGIQWVLLWLA